MSTALMRKPVFFEKRTLSKIRLPKSLISARISEKKYKKTRDKGQKTMADPKAAAPGAVAEKEAGNKKINKMTPAEIDVKLNEIKTAQGGQKSRYAKQLIQRKKALGS